MTFATGDDVVKALRLDPENFYDDEVQELVDDALGHLREASGTPEDKLPPETATGREFVTEYASGHALNRALQGGSGAADAEEAAGRLKRADKLLDRYDARYVGPDEPHGEGTAASVFNLSEEPLW